MKVSREQVAENRRNILEAAARLFRARGFEDVTVAEVMKAAGLTHGGFYGYFTSKDDLIAQTLAHALAAQTVKGDLDGYAAFYLRQRHRDDAAEGCAFAALGAETVRQAPDARAAMTTGLRDQIERLANAAPSGDAAEARQTAIGSFAAMVGGMILARLVDDPKLSDEILEQTRDWIKLPRASEPSPSGTQKATSR